MVATVTYIHIYLYYMCLNLYPHMNSYWYCKSEYQSIIGTEQSRNRACEVHSCWGGHILSEVQPVFTWEFQVTSCFVDRGARWAGLPTWQPSEHYG